MTDPNKPQAVPTPAERIADERIRALYPRPADARVPVNYASAYEAAKEAGVDYNRFCVALRLLATPPAAKPEQPKPDDYPEAAQVCAQAYQVVGSLLSDVGAFGSEHGRKILDNLAEHRLVHHDVLPWPSFEQPTPACQSCGGRGFVGDEARSGDGMEDYPCGQCEQPKPAGDDEPLTEWLVRRLAAQPAQGAPAYTTGHCPNHNQPGGCQLHNLHCRYPECDRKPAHGEGEK